MKVKVIIHREPVEGGRFWAEVPALPGCSTFADTREELFAHLKDAVEGVLLTERGDFEPAEPGGVEEEIDL
jgi:predicted RNase H-like HicB family nuclease